MPQYFPHFNAQKYNNNLIRQNSKILCGRYRFANGLLKENRQFFLKKTNFRFQLWLTLRMNLRLFLCISKN